jgi:hypothetical protein
MMGFNSGSEGTPILRKETHIAEFPALTQEDLEQIEKVYSNLQNILDFRIPEFKAYAGIAQEIGQGTIHNSPVTASQLEYAMAMTRSPLLAAMIHSPFGRKDFEVAKLVENKIMLGMKILDLGSGSWPVFARCCRCMGADVWTVDKETVTSEYEERIFPKEQQQIEHERHIQIDLNDPSAVEVIQGKTGGGFNLVTEGNLGADEFHEGKSIAIQLLKLGGVYYDPSSARGAVLKER